MKVLPQEKRNQIRASIHRTVEEVTGKKQNFESSSLLETLIADDLEKLEICMALEDLFSIQIPKEKQSSLQKIEDLYKYIENEL